jgi:hypothetical protein
MKGMDNTSESTSELDLVIPPQIMGDNFSRALQRVIWGHELRTILEIGSSSGDGSTQVLLSALAHKTAKPTVFCLEVSKPRFAQLEARYRSWPFVKCFLGSSVDPKEFPSEADVVSFYQTTASRLNQFPLAEVLRWREQDLAYLAQHPDLPACIIERIKKDFAVANFDLVLIDGSEFLGEAELSHVYGCRFVALDDTMTFKNFRNRERLLKDPNYCLIDEDTQQRNGWAIFQKVGD